MRGFCLSDNSYLRFELLFFLETLPNTNAAAATPIIVFVFLLNTCFATRFKFCGLSAKTSHEITIPVIAKWYIRTEFVPFFCKL